MIQVERLDREVLDLAGLSVAAGGLEGVAGAGAVDQDALLAVGGARLGEGGVDVLFGGDVAQAERPRRSRLGDRLALGVVHVEDGDLDALSGQGARRSLRPGLRSRR